MEKKTIKLTESELHGIIKEAVQNILSEGQGWDTFKYFVRHANDEPKNIEQSKEESNTKGDTWGRVRNFVNNGGEGNFRYYNPKRPGAGSKVYHDGYKEIDRSTMGKVGRAAGMGAGMAYKAASNAAHGMGGMIKKGASAAGRKASEMARNAKSQIMKNRINRQAKNYKSNGNGDYDSFTM